MKKNLFLASLLVMGISATNAQNGIKHNSDTSLNNKKKIKLDLKSLETQLASNLSRKKQNLIVSIPNAEQKNEQFVLIERDILAPKLKEKFPNIKSYYGYSTSNPSKKISLGYSNSRGINAIVYDEHDKHIIEKNENDYFLTNSKDLPSLENFNCGTTHLKDISKKTRDSENNQFNNPPFLRKYRLAIATDYSYNAYFAKEGQEPTLEDSFSAVNETLTYILSLYENDLSISFQLVDNLDKVTFLTKESNPYNIESEEEYPLLMENQRQLDEKIGSENYDLGILFTNAIGGGLADHNSLCNNETKGQSYMGYIASHRPEGFLFSSNAAHEMGHQFGAFHTYSKSDIFSVNANRETGSGVTIMGYAGATRTHDVTDHSIFQFHNYSLYEINGNLATQSCGIHTPSSNTPPIANAGKDYTIPKGTAFKLIGSASDKDHDNLTYSWEQDDIGTFEDYKTPDKNSAEGPNFRIYEHNSNPERYFPALDYVLNGQIYPTWNITSDVARELNFVFLVRDNQPGGGQIASDKTKINVTDNGPFKINNISLNQSFKVGETFTLQWNVAGTNTGEINTQNVRIKLTTDEGKTFTTLVESTPNNGSATVTLPSDLSAEKANIIIEAIDNIYYAASPFIAIGHEVSLSCKEYTNEKPFQLPTQNINNEGEDYFNISVTNEERLIEDISVITDIDTNAGGIYVGLRNKTEDTYYNTFYSANCSNPNVKWKFNQYGNNHFNICDTSNENAIEYPELDKYKSTVANGDYSFIFLSLETKPITVNKIGIELCFRETTTLSSIDFTKKQELVMYPNPTNGLFNIRMTTKTNKVNVDIMNMTGQIVMTKLFNLNANTINQSIDATNLTKGVYIVKISDGEQIQTKKLIIK